MVATDSPCARLAWALPILLIACGDGRITEAVAGPPRPVAVTEPAKDSPRTSEHRALLGRLDEVRATDRAAFAITGAFAPMPAVREGDWLESHAEPGQTVPQWVASEPNMPSAERGTIYLQPIGALPADRGPTIEDLAAHATAYFGLPVKVLAGLDPAFLTVRRREHEGHQQLNAADILDELETRLPADAYCVSALTLEDLYPDATFNYVFGLARLRERVGVFSFARYHPAFFEPGRTIEREVIVRRAFRIMTHEIGHMFGMEHCTFFSCNMNGSNNLDELDRQPGHLCPVCLRKLHLAVPLQPVARYETLARSYERHALGPEARWARDRVATLSAQ
jgi:archaemetzincin